MAPHLVRKRFRVRVRARVRVRLGRFRLRVAFDQVAPHLPIGGQRVLGPSHLVGVITR